MEKEPLGLPRGSVRALLAVGLTAACVWLWINGLVVPNELMAMAAAADAYYFASRDNEPPREAPLPEPYVGEGD